MVFLPGAEQWDPDDVAHQIEFQFNLARRAEQLAALADPSRPAEGSDQVLLMRLQRALGAVELALASDRTEEAAKIANWAYRQGLPRNSSPAPFFYQAILGMCAGEAEIIIAPEFMITVGRRGREAYLDFSLDSEVTATALRYFANAALIDGLLDWAPIAEGQETRAFSRAIAGIRMAISTPDLRAFRVLDGGIFDQEQSWLRREIDLIDPRQTTALAPFTELELRFSSRLTKSRQRLYGTPMDLSRQTVIDWPYLFACMALQTKAKAPRLEAVQATVSRLFTSKLAHELLETRRRSAIR